jgi:hypothetical protein
MVNNFASKEEAVKIVQQKRNKTRRRLISVLEFIFANILQMMILDYAYSRWHITRWHIIFVILLGMECCNLIFFCEFFAEHAHESCYYGLMSGFISYIFVACFVLDVVLTPLYIVLTGIEKNRTYLRLEKLPLTEDELKMANITDFMQYAKYVSQQGMARSYYFYLSIHFAFLLFHNKDSEKEILKDDVATEIYKLVAKSAVELLKKEYFAYDGELLATLYRYHHVVSRDEEIHEKIMSPYIEEIFFGLIEDEDYALGIEAVDNR